MNKSIPIICIIIFFGAIIMVYFNSTIEQPNTIIQDEYTFRTGEKLLLLVLESCECQTTEKGCYSYLAEWGNSTHYIDNNICEFITLEEHSKRK